MDPKRWAAGVYCDHPGQPTAAMVRVVQGWIRPVVRLAYRPVLEGAEHVPSAGPYLLVTNHSGGGLAIAELATLAVLWLERFGTSRPLAGFAHPFAFHAWPSSRVFPAMGAIPSTYEAAEATLAGGVPIVVFPGGDHETLRPVWQAYRVDFGGRVGFLRMAKKAWVPVVPMGIRGSAFTAPVLWRSRVLPTLLVWPRLVGAKRSGLTLLSVIGIAAILLTVPAPWPVRVFLAWVWAASPLTMLPWVPWSICMRVGTPIPPDELFGSREAGDEVLAGALVRVQGAVQALVRRGAPRAPETPRTGSGDETGPT